MSVTKLKAELQAALEKNNGDHTAQEVRNAKRALRVARQAKRDWRAAQVRAYDAAN